MGSIFPLSIGHRAKELSQRQPTAFDMMAPPASDDCFCFLWPGYVDINHHHSKEGLDASAFDKTEREAYFQLATDKKMRGQA